MYLEELQEFCEGIKSDTLLRDESADSELFLLIHDSDFSEYVMSPIEQQHRHVPVLQPAGTSPSVYLWYIMSVFVTWKLTVMSDHCPPRLVVHCLLS